MGLPMPDDRLELEGGTLEDPLAGRLLRKWLDSLPLSSTRCLIASVQRAKLRQLLDLLASCPAADRLLPPEVLRHDQLPIAVRTDQPEQVGIDRLLNGVSANYLRQPERPAIIVDMGSAITVDRVEMDGAFVGGAILPGLALSARALHMGTDLLPRILPGETQPQPAVVGKNTSASMAAGLYWGAIGAVREIVQRHMVEGDSPCEWFLTGGDALRVADELRSHDRPARYQEQMVLAGIWLVAQELS
jgi:type III pantothenate kinase